MTLIKSISGIRGTIGGAIGDNLTPIDIVKFTAAYARFIAESSAKERITIVVGRDRWLPTLSRVHLSVVVSML